MIAWSAHDSRSAAPERQVPALEFIISVNFWWAEGLVHQAVRVAKVFQRLRGLRL